MRKGRRGKRAPDSAAGALAFENVAAVQKEFLLHPFADRAGEKQLVVSITVPERALAPVDGRLAVPGLAF